MTVRRVMGLETEFGITAQGEPQANPILLSGQAVRAYVLSAGPGRALPTGSGWDYADETPLRDARGYEMARALADVSQLTDEDDPATANSVLSNGARLYVDHAHPEYSSPEVLTPRDAVTWDRAGELVMRQACEALAAQGRKLRIYKNNVDGKGASYGYHENYLMPREIPFLRIARALIPFFVARQVVCGAGRVGIGTSSQEPGFQISQRADYMETDIGLETTLKRPIVNTRDEPHSAAEKYRRLHVIVGDANLADTSTLLKVGMTSLVLGLIEQDRAPDLELADPVAAIRTFSRDTTLRATVPTTDGRQVRALDILAAYREAVAGVAADEAPGWEPDPDTTEVLDLWDDVTARLGRDPMDLAGELDWVAKLSLLQAYRDRGGLEWGDPTLAAIDIQYADLDPSRGFGVRMRDSGRLRSLVDAAAVETAVHTPPEDTRAFFRGSCVSRYPEEIRAASWDSVVFAVGDRGLRRVSLPEPLLGTRKDTGELLETHAGAAALLEALRTR